MSDNKIFSIDNLSLQEIDSNAELIPLLTREDEEEMKEKKFGGIFSGENTLIEYLVD